MDSEAFNRVVSCSTLPSLPTVAIRVLDMTRDQNVKLADLAATVENDPALAAKILKTVNSSFYGLPKPCPSITRAISYLGLNTIKSLVLGFSLVDWARHGEGGFDMMSYWRRSLYSAAAARRVAILADTCDSDEAFIAALMQDIGMLAMRTALGETYNEILEMDNGEHAMLSINENERLGFDHALAGAELANRWRFPPQIACLIRFHLQEIAPARCPQALHRCVFLGCTLAAALSPGATPAAALRFKEKAREWFNLADDALDNIMERIKADAQSLSDLFKVATGAAPNLQSLMTSAHEAAMEHQLAIQWQNEKLRETNDALSRAALIDGLTGIGNRRMFDEELSDSFDEARKFNASLAVVMIDADHFKEVNDSLGHQVGDEALTELARRMNERVGEKGLVCRYGGEEFAVILRGQNRADAALLADAIRQAVAEPPIDMSAVDPALEPVTVTVSCGVAVLEPETYGLFTSPHVLVQAADKALYAAKQSGRNAVRVTNPRRREEPRQRAA